MKSQKESMQPLTNFEKIKNIDKLVPKEFLHKIKERLKNVV